MKTFTHLDIFMKLWLEKKTAGATDRDLMPYADYLIGYETKSSHAGDILSQEPSKSDMAKWLKRQGMSQKIIASLMDITQQAVSSHVNKKDSLRPYKNWHLQQLAWNLHQYNHALHFNQDDSKPGVFEKPEEKYKVTRGIY